MLNEEYLGDGLYVSFDGHQFCLRAPRYNGDHVVFLDPSVLQAFDDYRRRAIKAATLEASEALRTDPNAAP